MTGEFPPAAIDFLVEENAEEVGGADNLSLGNAHGARDRTTRGREGELGTERPSVTGCNLKREPVASRSGVDGRRRGYIGDI